jgi:hypothetical protein
MKLQITVIACLLAALPAAAFADSQNDHTSSSRQAAPARSSVQAPSRSYQQAPSRSYQQAPSRSYQQAPSRSYQQQPSRSYQQAPSRSYQQQPSRSYQQAPRYTQPMPRYEARQPVRYDQPRIVANVNVRPWGWNEGRAWVASPRYWGGGFWGAFSLGLAFNNNAGYYQVAQASPGSQLLANYGLQQTDCNQPNLVDISGPDGSQICAYPNDEVAPGQYQVDPSTLSLVSQ